MALLSYLIIGLNWGKLNFYFLMKKGQGKWKLIEFSSDFWEIDVFSRNVQDWPWKILLLWKKYQQIWIYVTIDWFWDFGLLKFQIFTRKVKFLENDDLFFDFCKHTLQFHSISEIYMNINFNTFYQIFTTFLQNNWNFLLITFSKQKVQILCCKNWSLGIIIFNLEEFTIQHFF